MSQSILIVEDDPQIRRVTEIAVQAAGFKTELAGDGAEGLAKAKTGRFDLIVLDIGLPELDGLSLCRTLRQTDQTPIIFLTAMQDELDRVLGLELGGDDYLGKPFSPRELVARIKSILRRVVAPIQTGTRTIGRLCLDPDSHDVQFDTKKVALTAREMGILDTLSRNPSQVFSKAYLIDAVYGVGFHISERTLDSHIRNLRGKLADVGCHDALETLHGVGIRMGACRGTA
ncbi:MAG: response regulator transcription factor [Planktomarina sp.]